MRIILAIIVFGIGYGSLAGQSAEEKAILLKQEGAISVEQTRPSDQDAEMGAEAGQPETGKAKGHLGLSVGTGYSFSRGTGSGMMFYAVPAYTLPLNNRWSLHTGILAWHYQGLNPVIYGEYFSPMQYSSLAVFAAASYRMNERLVLHGTGIKRLVSAPQTLYNSFPMDHISLGATYKLGNNITIGATLHLNNGYGIYSSPYRGYGFAPPFYW